MRFFRIVTFALIVGATNSTSVPLALAAAECSKLAGLADLGENSTADISVASGGSCQFSIPVRGTVSSSDILQKPAHGKLKKLNPTTYEYKSKRRYKGSDAFVIKAMGQGSKASASVVNVNATIN
ncbi:MULTISPECIES: hypothetical protein [unclassified Bradyrhizobium]|uniref:hypothetical protein n=1 Tax=unclassified Bradyrhizobium TaxID=2631580 RepID=UPI002479A34F|nr:MULTISPECIES: hypothetical protein [unclassified Bradyrhizobium]WGR74588.1 hypothetical protein MTX24_17915 [Bradyrhizobium sp. ISRA426]WGR79423.1 hypothetical protein MTX21_03030 [Bradyrhizobium sp. ISRA430]WGR89760.1 hypothetical protein MTX25_17595 [Bradyrhizobium sp. ISRA432]